jgi:transposase
MKKKKEQKKYLEEKLEPKIELAKKGEIKLYFIDAAHFVHGAFLAYVWCFVRMFIQTPSGRKRFNVLGAIDAITHELITVTNETYINAISICELLEKIASKNINIAVTLVLDNARYQKCDLVTIRAKELGIELLYLPSYSPNLNIIERLWKWIKKDCLYSKYYDTFSKFKEAILLSLNKTQICKDEMDSLLNLKFQSFENIQVMHG